MKATVGGFWTQFRTGLSRERVMSTLRNREFPSYVSQLSLLPLVRTLKEQGACKVTLYSVRLKHSRVQEASK